MYYRKKNEGWWEGLRRKENGEISQHEFYQKYAIPEIERITHKNYNDYNVNKFNNYISNRWDYSNNYRFNGYKQNNFRTNFYRNNYYQEQQNDYYQREYQMSKNNYIYNSNKYSYNRENLNSYYNDNNSYLANNNYYNDNYNNNYYNNSNNYISDDYVNNNLSYYNNSLYISNINNKNSVYKSNAFESTNYRSGYYKNSGFNDINKNIGSNTNNNVDNSNNDKKENDINTEEEIKIEEVKKTDKIEESREANMVNKKRPEEENEIEKKLQKQEEEKKRKEEEERRIAIEIEQKRKQEERRIAIEIEQKRKEEERRIAIEIEQKRKEEERKIQNEEETINNNNNNEYQIYKKDNYVYYEKRKDNDNYEYYKVLDEREDGSFFGLFYKRENGKNTEQIKGNFKFENGKITRQDGGYIRQYINKKGNKTITYGYKEGDNKKIFVAKTKIGTADEAITLYSGRDSKKQDDSKVKYQIKNYEDENNYNIEIAGEYNTDKSYKYSVAKNENKLDYNITFNDEDVEYNYNKDDNTVQNNILSTILYDNRRTMYLNGRLEDKDGNKYYGIIFNNTSKINIPNKVRLADPFDIKDITGKFVVVNPTNNTVEKYVILINGVKQGITKTTYNDTEGKDKQIKHFRNYQCGMLLWEQKQYTDHTIRTNYQNFFNSKGEIDKTYKQGQETIVYKNNKYLKSIAYNYDTGKINEGKEIIIEDIKGNKSRFKIKENLNKSKNELKLELDDDTVITIKNYNPNGECFKNINNYIISKKSDINKKNEKESDNKSEKKKPAQIIQKELTNNTKEPEKKQEDRIKKNTQKLNIIEETKEEEKKDEENNEQKKVNLLKSSLHFNNNTELTNEYIEGCEMKIKKYKQDYPELSYEINKIQKKNNSGMITNYTLMLKEINNLIKQKIGTLKNNDIKENINDIDKEDFFLSGVITTEKHLKDKNENYTGKKIDIEIKIDENMKNKIEEFFEKVDDERVNNYINRESKKEGKEEKIKQLEEQKRKKEEEIKKKEEERKQREEEYPKEYLENLAAILMNSTTVYKEEEKQLEEQKRKKEEEIKKKEEENKNTHVEYIVDEVNEQILKQRRQDREDNMENTRNNLLTLFYKNDEKKIVKDFLEQKKPFSCQIISTIAGVGQKNKIIEIINENKTKNGVNYEKAYNEMKKLKEVIDNEKKKEKEAEMIKEQEQEKDEQEKEEQKKEDKKNDFIEKIQNILKKEDEDIKEELKTELIKYFKDYYPSVNVEKEFFNNFVKEKVFERIINFFEKEEETKIVDGNLIAEVKNKHGYQEITVTNNDKKKYEIIFYPNGKYKFCTYDDNEKIIVNSNEYNYITKPLNFPRTIAEVLKGVKKKDISLNPFINKEGYFSRIDRGKQTMCIVTEVKEKNETEIIKISYDGNFKSFEDIKNINLTGLRNNLTSNELFEGYIIDGKRKFGKTITINKSVIAGNIKDSHLVTGYHISGDKKNNNFYKDGLEITERKEIRKIINEVQHNQKSLYENKKKYKNS